MSIQANIRGDGFTHFLSRSASYHYSTESDGAADELHQTQDNEHRGDPPISFADNMEPKCIEELAYR